MKTWDEFAVLPLKQKLSYIASLAEDIKRWESFVVNNCYSCGYHVDWDSDVGGYFYECNRCGLDTGKYSLLHEAREAWQGKRVNWTHVKAFNGVSDEI